MKTNLTMKKVLLVLVLTLMAFTSKAQLYTGGSIQFLGVGNGDAVFGVAPEVGYSFNPKMAVGTSLGLLFGGGGALSIDPYFRYHFVNWGPVRFFADAQVERRERNLLFLDDDDTCVKVNSAHVERVVSRFQFTARPKSIDFVDEILGELDKSVRFLDAAANSIRS